MNAIVESLKIMANAVNKQLICPDCGSNTLQHELGLLMGEDWTSPHKYKNLQDLDGDGWYRCEEGHFFKVYYDEANDEFYMK